MSLDQLPPEVNPPSSLEARTVAALRREKLLSARLDWRTVAAAVVMFAVGAWAGASWTSDGRIGPGQDRFLLLLHGATTSSPEQEANAVEAYRAWASQLRSEGRLVSGERLGQATVIVPSVPLPTDAAQGFFIVSAADLEEAKRLAESAPHVARGGVVVVRPIDTP
jgi:hypothetical protein